MLFLRLFCRRFHQVKPFSLPVCRRVIHCEISPVCHAAPAVYIGAAHRAEHSGLKAWFLLFLPVNKLLHILPRRVAVHRAERLDYIRNILPCGTPDVLFRRKAQRTDQCEVSARQIGFRRETAESSLNKQIHQKGLDRIVHMMTERQFVAVKRLRVIVQCTAPELCT